MGLRSSIDRIIRHDAFGGVLLMVSAVAAMLVANSTWSGTYDRVLSSYLAVTIDGEGLQKPLILWINDGLMAVFFFLIGLELKAELMEGKLKNPRDVILPGAAAIGGMIVPALIFVWFNWGLASVGGWAIPAATDIAFALGILALVGSRAPASLKVFLLTLAILDDMGAIIIIALFYTENLQVNYLLTALLPLAGMIVLNLRGSHRQGMTIFLGIVLWVLVLRSGVHATLAGVVTAFCIPLTDRWGKSPLHSLEHAVSPWSIYFIIPVFAFANAGVVLTGMKLTDLFDPLPLGIALGLLLGKQIGVFGVAFALVKTRVASLPFGANWMHIYGISCLAGVGFTMSLFIGGLSFESDEMMNQVRMGVLSGSILSGLLGYGALMLAGRATTQEDETKQTPPATATELGQSGDVKPDAAR